jgi:hypothetical protein
MRHIPMRSGQEVFIDYGCGMGRVIVMAAATFPMKRVIGVEYSEWLSNVSRENVGRVGAKLLCRDVEIVTSDAVAYEVPPDASIFYFNNPFSGHVLAATLDRIKDSLRRSPREIKFIWNHWCAELPPELHEVSRRWLHLQRVVPLDGDRTGYLFVAGRDKPITTAH